MCSLPFEYCEWGPQFPKCKEWFQGNFQRFYPEVGTADLAHEDVVALMKRLGFEGEAHIRDLWSREDLGMFSGVFSTQLAPHASALYLIDG